MIRASVALMFLAFAAARYFLGYTMDLLFYFDEWMAGGLGFILMRYHNCSSGPIQAIVV